MSDLYTPGGWVSTGVGWLVGLFSGLGKAEKNAVNTIGLHLVTLAQGVAAAFVKTGKYLKAFGELFKKLWTNIIRPILAWCVKNLDLLKKKLKEWFGPIVTWLLKVRGKILDIYNKWVRPVLDTIDIIRRGLRLLGALGVDWAKALDTKLGTIESKIEEPFLQLMSKINEIIGWIDRIITLDGLFQRITLFRSLFEYRLAYLNFNINTGFRKMNGAEQDYYNKAGDPKQPIGVEVSSLIQTVRFEGPLAAKAREHTADLIRLVRS